MLGSLSWSDISSENNCFEPDEKETCPDEGLKAPPLPETSAARQQSNWVAAIIATVSLIVILLLIVGSSFRKKMFRKWIEKESDRNHENASRSAHSSEDYSFVDNIRRNFPHDPLLEQFEMRTISPRQSFTDFDNLTEETDSLDVTTPKEIGTSERTRSHDDIENYHESIRTRQSEDRNQENNRTQTQQRQPPLMFCVSQPNYMPFLPPLGEQQQIVGLQYAFPPHVASPFLAADPNFVCPTTVVSTPSSHPSVISGYINYNSS